MLHLHAPTTETERIERARLDAEVGLAGAREAAANGDLDAMLRLIALLLDGIGAARIGRNSAEADEWIHRAADAGPDAMRRIGDLLLSYRSGSGVDPAAAAPWFAKAAEAGEVRAIIELAGLLWQGWGIARDRVAAVRWMREAAEAGTAVAMGRLGMMLREDDPTSAAEWYRKGAEAGKATAMYCLAACLESGGGIERNLVAAREWYRRAWETDGDEEARAALVRLGGFECG